MPVDWIQMPNTSEAMQATTQLFTGRIVHVSAAPRLSLCRTTHSKLHIFQTSSPSQRSAIIASAGFGKSTSTKKAGKGKGFDKTATHDPEAEERTPCACGSRRPYKVCVRPVSCSIYFLHHTTS